MIHCIDRRHTSGTTYCGNSHAQFVFQYSRIGSSDNAASVQQCFHSGGNICRINRRTENYPVSSNHFAKYLSKTVFAEYTIAFAFTGKTSTAWLYIDICQLNKLGFNSFLIQFFKYDADYDCRVAIFPCAAVNADYFHCRNDFNESLANIVGVNSTIR